MDKFVIHGCEQVLRFTRADKWNVLSEERKVQLGFNLGVTAHGLNLEKADSYQKLADAREGLISMQEFREHMLSVIKSHGIVVDEAMVAKPF